MAPQNPLPDILDFLLQLFMSRSSELKRDDVREQARQHWMALQSYLKDGAEAPVETPLDREPPVRPPAHVGRRGDHRVARRFTPRQRQIA